MNKLASSGERGGARLKFVIVMAIIAIIGLVGYAYVPVAYESYLLKDVMQHNVDVAATQGYPPSWIQDQLTKAGKDYGVPPNAVIEPIQRGDRMEVRVQFVRPIEFLGFTYQYNFDYTVKSTAFLTFK